MSDLSHGLRPYRRAATFVESDTLRIPALDAAVRRAQEERAADEYASDETHDEETPR